MQANKIALTRSVALNSGVSLQQYEDALFRASQQGYTENDLAFFFIEGQWKAAVKTKYGYKVHHNGHLTGVWFFL